MKKSNVFFIVIALLFISCKDAAPTEAPEASPTAENKEVAKAPNYELFNNNVAIMRAFYTAHENEDLEAQKSMLADTIRVSPPNYNNNELVGKEEFVTLLKKYHDSFENIKYTEGIKLGTLEEDGWWSGSVFPKENASSNPNSLRVYGTWTATHTESQKEIGVKYFSLVWINKDGKIAQYSPYYDINGIAAQLMDEE